MSKNTLYNWARNLIFLCAGRGPCSTMTVLSFEAEILSTFRENCLKMTCLYFLWEFRNSWFENEASGKTKMDATWIWSNLSYKTAYLCEFYEEIPLHIIYINGLELYLPSDIHGYEVSCWNWILFAVKLLSEAMNQPNHVKVRLLNCLAWFPCSWIT